MLDRIADIRDAITCDESTISIDTVQAIGQHFQQKLLRRQSEEPQRDVNVFTHVAEELARSYKVKPTQASNDATSLRDPDSTVLEFTEDMVRKDRNGVQYALAFIFAAAAQDQANHTIRNWHKKLCTHNHPSVSNLSLPGALEKITIFHGRKTERVDVPSNHYFLLKNIRDNYVRLITGEEVEYEELHHRNMYLFTTRNEPTFFASELTSYTNGPQNKDKLIENRDVCEIGVGNGADTEFFLKNGRAKSVTIIDGSPSVIAKLKDRREHMPLDLQPRFDIPEAGDMFDMLEHFISQQISFDTLCAHSSVHYFDDESLRKLLKLMRKCIRPGGHLAISVKAPGAVLDGNGIPLLREVEDLGSADHEKYVKKSMWLNFDGQMRMFRSLERWEKILNEEFKVSRSSRTMYLDYETPGQGEQMFYHLICDQKPVSLQSVDSRQSSKEAQVSSPITIHPYSSQSSVPSGNKTRVPTNRRRVK